MSSIVTMTKQVDKVNHMNKPLPQEIFDAIAGINHQLRSRLQQAARERQSPVSGMEFRALNFIGRRPGATQRDLVEHSGRDKAQIARIISNLRQLELIETRPDPNDRRATCLYLSPSGQTINNDFRDTSQQLIGQAINGLSHNECQTLLTLLTKMSHNLEG